MDVTASVITLVEWAIQEEPALVAEFKSLFGQEAPPTAEQFAALRAKVASEDFGT